MNGIVEIIVMAKVKYLALNINRLNKFDVSIKVCRNKIWIPFNLNYMKTIILSKEIAQKKIRRMAMEVAERNHDKTSLILVGIKENGMVIAEKVAYYLKDTFKGTILLYSLTLNKKNPGKIELSGVVDFNGATVLLIDDVANSGRTMLYSLKPILEQYPTCIQTMALVERTHKLFPVDVDYVGFSVSTTADEMIVLEVDNGEVVGAFLEKG